VLKRRCCLKRLHGRAVKIDSRTATLLACAAVVLAYSPPGLEQVEVILTRRSTVEYRIGSKTEVIDLTDSCFGVIFAPFARR
jgi:hypothetical protein